MASTKKSPAAATAPAKLSTRALEHGLNAAGARFLRQGFGRTEQDDVLFALGYPHLALLSDEAVDATLASSYAVAFSSRESWPAALAPGLVRGAMTPTPYVEGPYGPTLGDAGPTLAAFANQAALTDAEAERALQWLFPAAFCAVPDARSLFLLEALLGSSFVLGRALETLEGLPAGGLSTESPGLHGNLVELGYLLLRVPEPEARAARATLEALYLKALAASKSNESGAAVPAHRTGLTALDQVLHGEEAAKKIGDLNRLKVPTREAVLHVHEDPGFVLATLQAWPLGKGSATAPDARWVFLAGSEALEFEKSQWPFYTSSKSDQPRWVSSFGRIADPRVEDVLLAMALSSKNAKKEALLALQARPDEARAACDRLGAEADALRKKL